MLLLFILIIIWLMYCSFLVQNIFFGVLGSEYYLSYTAYPFDEITAISTLSFVVLNTFFFIVGYFIAVRRTPVAASPISKSTYDLKPLFIIYFILYFIVGSYIAYISGFNYGPITEMRWKYSFFFELRAGALILFAYYLFNVKPVYWIRDYLVVLSVFCFVIAILLMQARSILFELFVVFMFAYYKWHGTHIRKSHLVILCVIFIIPNIMVLSRFYGHGLTSSEIISGLFSFEYSVLFNNILSGTMLYVNEFSYGGTMLQSIMNVVPSPIRSALGIQSLASNEVYRSIGEYSDVYGGGFSLFASAYIEFGWCSFLLFLVLGCITGRAKVVCFSGGEVTLKTCFYPLFYASLVLAMRNDLGVFVKYLLQIVMLSYILDYISRKIILK